MLQPKIDFERLSDAFGRLLDVAKVKSRIGRTMAFFEVFLAVFLLLALLALYGHEMILAVIAACQGREFHVSEAPFYVLSFALIASVAFVGAAEWLRK